MVFFCEHCHKKTNFLPIHAAADDVGVSRTTMYIWMQRAQVHWLELPSGRAMICKQSLLHRAYKAANLIQIPKSRPSGVLPQGQYRATLQVKTRKSKNKELLDIIGRRITYLTPGDGFEMLDRMFTTLGI